MRLNVEVLLFDAVGDHAALVCADIFARMGCKVQHVRPDRATALADIARGGIGGHVDIGRIAVDHLGEEPTRFGTRGQADMVMTKAGVDP